MTIVLPDTKIGNLMTDKGMSVGLLVSVIGHTVGIWQWKGPGSVRDQNTDRKKGHWNEINGAKMGKAFAENKIISERFVIAGLQALPSQLWNIHWTSCWPSDPQVKDVWIREE